MATQARPPSTSDATSARLGAADGPVYGDGQVSMPAHVVGKIAPTYPEEARRAEVEADVVLEILVETDGRVRDARSLNRRGYGLDEAALAAIRACRFSPALRDGRPVRVRMRWTVQFRLTR
jgi:TonB family protein